LTRRRRGGDIAGAFFRFVEPVDASEEHSGSMVMRAWLEGGRPDRLRVRIFSAIGARQAPAAAASSAGAVHAAVEDWLTKLQSRPDDVSVTPH